MAESRQNSNRNDLMSVVKDKHSSFTRKKVPFDLTGGNYFFYTLLTPPKNSFVEPWVQLASYITYDILF